MDNYEKAKHAYLNDPVYRTLVESMLHAIHSLQTTPSELREAAMFASILYGQTNPKPPIFRKEGKGDE
jgi:hypothetical protein